MKPKKSKTPAVPAAKAVSSSTIQTSGSAPKFRPLTSFARAKKRLIERHGWKEDELTGSFKTEDELLKFYNEIARAEFDKKAEDEVGWDSEDVFDAPADEKARLAARRVGVQREKFEAVNQPATAADAGQIAQPAKPVISFADFLAAGDDLAKLTAEIGEIDPEAPITDHESKKL